MDIGKITRERGDNWTNKDKEIIIEIMKDSSKIVDNKSIKTTSNMQKNSEWLKIQKKFCDLSGSTRSVHQLKGAWRRIKSSKNIVSQQKTPLNFKGGQKSPSLSEEDRKIIDIISPTDFIIVDNEYDSDNIFQRVDIQENDAIIIEHNVFENKTNCNRKKKNTVEENETNINTKEKSIKCCEEEQALKIKYWQKELSHQDQKHKLELEILTLEKRKKILEILKLK